MGNTTNARSAEGTPTLARCLSSLDHYASGIKGNLLKTEFPDSWMGQELGLDML